MSVSIITSRKTSMYVKNLKDEFDVDCRPSDEIYFS